MPSAIERAKQVDLAALVRSHGVELRRNGRGLRGKCPFHRDGSPSLSVTPSRGLWHCFSCGVGGSAIDWVMQAENVSIAEAIRRLTDETDLPRRPRTKAARPAPLDLELLEEAARLYQDALAKALRARQYLGRRGILDPDLIERFRLGYGSGALKGALDQERGEKAGVFTERGSDRFYRAIVFPITDPEDRVVGFYGRHTQRDRHLYLPGPHRGVFNWQAVRDHRHVILTESIIDCLSAWRLGVSAAIPIYGTSGFTPHHADLFRRFPGREVTILLDNDEAGERAVERITEHLAPLPVKVFRARLPDGVEDVNELLVRGATARELLALLDAREPIATTTTATTENAPSRTANAPRTENLATPLHPRPTSTSAAFLSASRLTASPTVAYEEGKAQVTIGEIDFAVRGLRLFAGDSLRLVVTASREGRRYCDRFDLFIGRSRLAFARKAAGRLGVEAETIEENLEKLTDELLALQVAERARAELEAEPEEKKLTEDEREEALAFLAEKDLLAQVAEDLDRLGYVGEREAKELLYLVATSRLTARPMAAIVQSQSGTGKSTLMELVASLMPPEQTELLSRLTPQSLFYMEPGALKHKLLIIDEKAGTEGAEYSLRTLQSQRRLTLLAPMRDPASGKMRTARFEVEGPVAFMESTTRKNLNPENANRCFVVVLDDSSEQTRRVHRAQRRSYDPAAWEREGEREAIVRRHQNAQRLLEPIRVAIPFADRLHFPVRSAATRRQHERLLSLVAMIAFLHQKSREVLEGPDGTRYIEATVGDYHHAYRLAQTAIARGLSDLSDDGKALLGIVRALILKKSEQLEVDFERVSVTRREVREESGWAHFRVRHVLEELVELELLDAEGRNGRRYEYRLSSRPEHDPPLGLTPPSDLVQELGRVREP